MASPPFSVNITSPANTDVAANFPTLDRSDKDVFQSWLLTTGNVQGRNSQLALDIIGGSVGYGAAPTPGAGIAAIYYDNTQTLQEYRGDKAVVVQLSVPVGAILPFAGSTAPNGYLLCQGQAISRTTFAVLFAILSTTWGAGNGSTTFNIPDLQGRTVYGIDNGAGRLTANNTLGAAGPGQSITIAQANLPNVNWTVTDPGHAHSTLGSGGGDGFFSGSGHGSGGTTGTSTTGITVSSGGSGTALTPQPGLYACMNWIIRAF